MPTLPILTPRTYISQSAFKTSENCFWKFYQTYLAGNKYIQSAQTRPAGIGTVFDLYVKSIINAELKLNDPRFSTYISTDEMFKDIIWEDDVDAEEAISVGCHAAEWYLNKNLHKKIKDHFWLLDRELFTIHNGVPIEGILDIGLTYGPLDFKLRGFNSSASPTKGYNKKISEGGKLYPPHDESRHPHPLENFHRDWAIQMLWYMWCMQPYTKETINTYVIHEICQTGTGNLIFAEHEGKISSSFDREIFMALERLWKRITAIDINVPKPIPRVSVCEAFRSVCKVADKCPEYQCTLGNPEQRPLYV